MTKHAFLKVSLCTLALALGGCPTAGRGVEAGPTSEAASTDGAKTVSMPATWPTDVPLYPGATLVNAEGEPNNQHISFNTSDECPAVASYYKERLAALKLESDDGSTLIFSADGGQRNVSLACQPGEPAFVLINAIHL